METQQRFEGARVEEVLKEVRATLGFDAKIIAANKIRTGGIGGFFAKETYEVIAAPANPTAALPSGIDEEMFDRASEQVMRGSSSKSLLELADLVSGAEDQVAKTSQVGAARTNGQSVRPSAQSALPATSDRAPEMIPQTWAPPAEAQSAQTRHLAAPPAEMLAAPPSFEPLRPDDMPRLSTEGGPFNDVLQRMAADAAPDIAEAIDRHMGTSMGAATDSPARGLKPVGPQAQTTLPTPLAMARDPLPPAAPLPPVAPPPAPQPPADVLMAPGPVTVEPVFHDAVPEMSAVATAVPVVPKPVPEINRTAHLLSCLDAGNLPRSTVVSALHGLPQAPALPETSGVVVVVVGNRQAALKLCRKMARAHKSDPSDVVLASQTYRGSSIPADRRILDLTEASRDRRSWHRREQPTFVAVDTPACLHSKGLSWSRDIVTRLEPHLVIGLASATRKTEDIAIWAQGAGGVDGLALFDVADTTSPHAVLSLEIPVVYLDNAPATATTWANLLLEGSKT